MTHLLKNLDWRNTLFLTLTPLTALFGIPLYLYFFNLKSETFILFFAYMILTGLAITAGYHRLFSHKTYQTVWPVRLFWLCFGAASFQNSALKWSADHRDHHQFVDTPKDPYSIKEGFWHAHILWILKNTDRTQWDNVQDLKKDPLVVWQHRHVFAIGFIVGIVLPTLFGAFWGDALGGFLWAGILRIVLNHHFTFFINSLAHYIGTQPYSNQNTAKDNWLMAFLTYGEGYHNFHHAFPTDYRNGLRFYQWDPAKWLIFTLHKLGLAFGLKRIPEQTPLIIKLKKEEHKLALLFKTKQKLASEEWQHSVLMARKHLEEASQRFFTLKAEYQRIKKQKTDSFKDKLWHHKVEMDTARLQFKQALKNWQKTYKTCQTQFTLI